MKNSDQLKAELEKIQVQIKDLQLKEREVRVKYMRAIEEESEFKQGEKVALYKTGYQGIDRFVDYGIYAGFRTKYGWVEPIVFKIKKDGTASKYEHIYYHNFKIKKIEQ